MALVTGPRQSGKTTLAKTPQQILEIPGNDDVRIKPVIVLDEIHKTKLWKRTLKGIFDTTNKLVDFLITGSARLDTFKKEGKLYLWDYAEVPTLGHKFENLVASHLLKACNYWTDAGYGKFQLTYLRDADHCEIDFLILFV